VRRSVDALVDVMRVPASGDAFAVLPAPPPASSPPEDCDVLIAGGGTGGVAAALAAARSGSRVVLLEETDWLGGQLSSQGVSALDEHEHIESCGGTASYYTLRNAIRAHYGEPNPGNCWVTRLAFEPRVAVDVIERMLAPHVEAGRLSIHRRTKTVAVTTKSDGIAALEALGLDDGRVMRFRPRMVIDATELGDLLPLSGTEYVVGAETIAQTGEAQAQPREPKPHCVQSFTYTVACELRPAAENRRREEHRHDAHHQWLLPAAPGGMERGRSGRCARRVRARSRRRAARCTRGCRPPAALSGAPARRGRAAGLAENGVI